MATTNGAVSEPTPEQERFEIELEFMQCLASPAYLHFLAQNQYFEDPAFLRYLGYLLYWTKPTYARFVAYPHALYFLQLLQRPHFRTALKSPQYALLLHQQQGYHWQFASTPSFHPRNPEDPLPPPPLSTGAELHVPPSLSVADPSPSPGLDTPAQTPGAFDTPRESPVTASYAV